MKPPLRVVTRDPNVTPEQKAIRRARMAAAGARIAAAPHELESSDIGEPYLTEDAARQIAKAVADAKPIPAGMTIEDLFDAKEAEWAASDAGKTST